MASPSIPPKDRWLGAGCVAAAVAFQVLWLGLPAISVSVLLVVAYGLWAGTPWRVDPRLRSWLVAGLAVFVVHIVEEWLGALPVALPELFGREPWTTPRWAVFNGLWMAVFCAAAATVGPGRGLPVLFILFFAVAGGVGNGVLHLLLWLQSGGYFPGVWTAPACLMVGVRLLQLLYGEEDPRSSGEDARGTGAAGGLGG